MRLLVVATLLLSTLVPGRALAAPGALVSPLGVDVDLLEQVESLLGDAQLQAGRDEPARKGSGASAGDTGAAPTSSSVNLADAGASSTPQGRQFGIGLQLGLPTALVIKYMLQPNQGIAAGIGGFSGFVLNSGSITIFVDYLYHPHLLTAGEAFALTWYVGGGGQVIINDRFATPYIRGVLYPGFYYGSYFWLAGRVPLGVNLALAQAPLEVFAEVVPSILLFPALSFGVGGSIGVRFYL